MRPKEGIAKRSTAARTRRLLLGAVLAATTLAAAPAVASASCVAVGGKPRVTGLALTKAEKRAITITRICATRSVTGAEIDVTFAGNLQQMLGTGHLAHFAVGVAASKSGVHGAGASLSVLGTSGTSARSSDFQSPNLGATAVARDGSVVSFFMIGATLAGDSRFDVGAVPLAGRGRVRAAADASETFAQLLSGIVDVRGLTLPPPGVTDCRDLAQLIAQAQGKIAELQRSQRLFMQAQQQALHEWQAARNPRDEAKWKTMAGAYGLDLTGLRIDLERLQSWLNEARSEYARRCRPPTTGAGAGTGTGTSTGSGTTGAGSGASGSGSTGSGGSGSGSGSGGGTTSPLGVQITSPSADPFFMGSDNPSFAVGSQATGGTPPYSFSWSTTPATMTWAGQNQMLTLPSTFSLTNGRSNYSYMVTVQDSQGRTASAAWSAVVACNQTQIASGDIGSGTQSLFQACGRIDTGGMQPASVRFTPIGNQFNGNFNVFETVSGAPCPTITPTEIDCSQPKPLAENPLGFVGGVFSMLNPLASGQGMRIEEFDSGNASLGSITVSLP